MAINMDEVRATALYLRGRKVPAYPMKYARSARQMREMYPDAPLWVCWPSVKLPADFYTATFNFNMRNFAVLSAAEAADKRGTHRPHRIEAQCLHCGRWFPAGRVVQHEKFCKEKNK